MDSTSLVILIIGIICLTGGIVTGFILYIKSLKDTAVKDATIAILQDQLADTDNLKLYITRVITSLQNVGHILPAADPLNITPEDIVIEHKPEPPTPATHTEPPDLPTVPGLTAQELIDALTHAALRTGPRSDRPFSRRYMVDKGPLTKTKLDHLLDALKTNGYVDQNGNSPTLTTRGQALLNRVKNGQY